MSYDQGVSVRWTGTLSFWWLQARLPMGSNTIIIGNWAKAKKHIRVDNFPVHLLFLHEESLGQSAMVINYPEETWGDK